MYTLLTSVHNDADNANTTFDADDADNYNRVIGIALLRAFGCAKNEDNESGRSLIFIYFWLTLAESQPYKFISSQSKWMCISLNGTYHTLNIHFKTVVPPWVAYYHIHLTNSAKSRES